MANDTRTGFGRVFAMGCLALVFLTLALAPAMMGQSASTGALAGQVKDASGAVVPNATVTLTNTGTAQTRTTKTTSDGNYKFGFLPPGSYRVRFEAAGFSTADVASVTVNVTETPVLDQTLSVGGQTTTVEVVGETQAVQTASSTVGTVVSGRTLSELPLTTRNYTNLLGLTSGANAAVFNATTMGRGTTDVAVNGSSIWQNNYQQDGASIVQSSGRGGAADSGANPGIGVVNPDAIGEYKIQTSGFDAGYGRNPGANVNVVTKSGTNQWHGSAFEFFRNTSLNANEFFLKSAGKPRGRLDQHQFGGTFGGAVVKDKLFFFTSYQESRQKNGLSPAGLSNPVLPGIPSGDRSSAGFQAALGAAFCPGGSATTSTTNGTRNGGQQVLCNGSNINPVALNILRLKLPDGSYYLKSSRDYTTSLVNANVPFSTPALFKEHQGVGNVDYLINNNNTLSARYFYSRANTKAPLGCGATGATVTTCLPGGPGTISFLSNYNTLKLTSILSNNVVNEARTSLQIIATDLSNDVPFSDSQVGIRPLRPDYDIFGTVQVSGLFQMGAILALASPKTNPIWQVADQISWSHGKHTTRMGLEYERDRFNWHFDGLSVTNLQFNTFQDFLIGLPGGCGVSVAGVCNGTTQSNIANTGVSASVTPAGGLVHYYRNAAASAFVQDDYKVMSNLTLNLGLRWEYNGQITDANGNLTNVWPNLINAVPVPGATRATGTLAGFVVPSNYNPSLYPAPPVSGIFQNDKPLMTAADPTLKNFAPRVGFAWKPLASDRFVIRGGGGYFYDRLGQSSFNKPSVQAQPYSITLSKSGTANAASSFSTPYDPTVSVGWQPRFQSLTTPATNSGLNILLLDPNYKNPVTYQWNLNVQYEFLPKWVLELGYVGSRGLHLVPETTIGETQLNGARIASPTNPIVIPGLATPITTNTAANIPLRVPYLGFVPTGVQADLTNGDSKYSSLQLTVRKQLSHGFSMQAAYSFSRSFNTAGYNGVFTTSGTPYGPNIQYRPHRLAINYSYELPFGTHEGLLGKVTSGWTVAGVTVVQSGLPLTITDSRGGGVYGYSNSSTSTSVAQFVPGKGNADVPTTGDIFTRLGGNFGGVGYLDKNAFGTTPIAANSPDNLTLFGNAGYGIVYGPGQANFDATIQKTTRVGGLREDANLVFRTEFFNVFNHTQFLAPGTLDVSNANFGRITSTAVNPRLIQFALKYVF